MTVEELIEALEAIARERADLEIDHLNADDLLLAYIADPRVTAAFESIEKWYA